MLRTRTKGASKTYMNLYSLLVTTKSGMSARTGGAIFGLDTPTQVERRLGTAEFRRRYMNRIVKWELQYIPRGEKGSPQNFLRFSYNALRRKHFSLGKTRHETMKALIEKIQKAYPDFTPLYDKDFFKI